MAAQQIVLNLLKKIAEEREYAEYSAVQITGGSTTTSYHATLTAAERPNLKLYAKVAAMPENWRKGHTPSPYSVELYFYSTLQHKFEKLEENLSVPVDFRLRTPKLYGSSAEYLRESLVLEDLNVQGYQNFNKNNPADMEFMTAGIEMMAQFHALSMAYHKNNSVDFSLTKEVLAIDVSKMETFFMSTINHGLISNAYAVAEGQHRARLEKYFKEPDRLRQILNLYRSYNRNILVHGDFKPSNLMHRRRNGKLEIAVVDFQWVHEGDPVTELLYFIFTATDEQLRRDHYLALLDLYYQRLKAALLRVNIAPELVYPESTYRARLEELKMLGLVIAVSLLPVVLADRGPDFSVDTKASFFLTKGGALFGERFNGVLNNYVEWGLL